MTTKERKKEYNKKYYLENKEKSKEYNRRYYLKNKEKALQYRKERYELVDKEIMKKHYEDNKELHKERNKKYYLENKSYFKDYSKKWIKNQRENNPLFRLKCSLRSRTYLAFKDGGYSKKSKTNETLGVEWDIVKQHIERQFIEGMTWDNYGEWQVDHIYPLSKAKSEEEMVKLCHYTNLQPLWRYDNISKQDKIVEHQAKLTL